jgi:hypothetical protein
MLMKIYYMAASRSIKQLINLQVKNVSMAYRLQLEAIETSMVYESNLPV